MNMEIERIGEVRKQLSADARNEMDEAIECINAAFKSLIGASVNELKREVSSEIDYSKVSKALKKIAQLAASVGMDFPVIESEGEIRTYILKYGMEIVKS